MGLFRTLAQVAAGGLLLASFFVPGLSFATAALIGSGLLFAARVIEGVPKVGVEKRQLTLRSRRDQGAPIPVVYGTAKVGSIINDVIVNPDTDNQTLVLVVTFAHNSRDGEQVGAVHEIYFDDSLAIDESDTIRDPWSSAHIGFLKFPGLANHDISITSIPAPDNFTPIVLSSMDDSTWETTDKGRGLVAAVFQLVNTNLESDPAKPSRFTFPRGTPQVSAVIKGNFVEDTRSEVSGVNITFADANPDTITRASGSFVTDGWVANDRVAVSGSASNDGSSPYNIGSVTATVLTLVAAEILVAEGPSGGITLKRWAHPDNGGDNNSMCLRDYLLSPIYGADVEGTGDTLLNEQSFKDAADVCDETVSTPSGNQNRFRCNGWIDIGQTIQENISQLLSSFRGNLVFEAGLFGVYTRRSMSAPTFTLNEDNIVGQWSFHNAGIEDKWNLVVSSYVEPGENGTYKAKQTQWPRLSSPGNYLTNDGGFENRLDLDLPFTTNQHTAQHICQVVLNESRQSIRVQLRALEEALELSVGDVVDVTHDTPAWSGKTFWVAQMQLLPDSTVGLSLQEYDAAAYSLDTMDDKDTEPDTLLGDLFSVVAPTSVQMHSDTTEARIKITWTEAQDGNIDYYEVQAKHVGNWSYHTVARIRGAEAVTEAFVGGIRNGETWQARVRTVNTIGSASTWAESPTHVAVIHDTPSVTLTLTPQASGVDITISDFDADGDSINADRVELYVRENNATGGPNPLETAPYWVATVRPGDGAFLEPAADGQWVKALAVPFNIWGERGTPTAVAEAESGATGAGPTAPPNTLASPSQTAETIDITWVDGDGTVDFTRIYVDTVTFDDVAAGASPETITGLESDTIYVIGLRHNKNGIFNPLETAQAIEITQATIKGTLGAPGSLAAQTINPATVRLTWTVGTDGEEATYTIRRASDSGFTADVTTLATGVSGLTFDHREDGEADNAWFFRVKAVRTNWNDSPETASVSGTYGSPPTIDNCVLTITAPVLCTAGDCKAVLGCTSLGQRILIRWNHTGGDDSLHHIRILESKNGGAFTEVVDDLSVDAVPECGLRTYDGGWIRAFVGKCKDLTQPNDTYAYKVRLELDGGDVLVGTECTTGTVTQYGTTVCVL